MVQDYGHCPIIGDRGITGKNLYFVKPLQVIFRLACLLKINLTIAWTIKFRKWQKKKDYSKTRTNTFKKKKKRTEMIKCATPWFTAQIGQVRLNSEHEPPSDPQTSRYSSPPCTKNAKIRSFIQYLTPVCSNSFKSRPRSVFFFSKPNPTFYRWIDLKRTEKETGTREDIKY